MPEKKKYWLKRSSVSLDKNVRKMTTVTLRWMEADPSNVIGGVVSKVEKKVTIGPDDILEGDHFEQFVADGILEIWSESRASNHDRALREAEAVARSNIVAGGIPAGQVEKPVVADETSDETDDKAPVDDSKDKSSKIEMKTKKKSKFKK
jgi:hypothetical protein